MLYLRDKLRSLLQYKRNTLFSFGIVSLVLIAPFFIQRPPMPTRPPTPLKKIDSVTLPPKKSPVTTPTTVPVQSLAGVGVNNKILFGLGSEADGAIQARLVKEAPVHMLTSWYNGPNDLTWMTPWKNDLVPSLYAQGYALHLITFTDYPETNFQTKYGPACGREYPLSAGYLDDMKQLAQTFSGSGDLYVTLFTEFQTYPCTDNTWVGSENYYNALKDQFRATKKIFKEYAPNAKVTVSWGGWQSKWDDTKNGGGRSLFPHFADIMAESDFSSFQAMESGANVQDIKDMTKILASYKRPVMLSHYKPDNGSQTTYDADMQTVLTDETIKELTTNGLFAFSFMDTVNMNANESTYQSISGAVKKYGK